LAESNIEWSCEKVIHCHNNKNSTPEKVRVLSPMTPEQLTSTNRLDNDFLVKSKSINEVPAFFVDGPDDSNFE